MNQNNIKPRQQALRKTAVSGSLSFEEYIKEQIEEGYISENGTPLKC